jgi:U3 small nucleolar ribonucleoprotein protein LCP5
LWVFSEVPEQVRVDASALVQLLSEFTQKVNALRSFVQELTQRIVDGELQTSKGISLLEVKSHLLLQYCVNLGCLLLQKLDGQSIAGHAVIKQLIVLRVYLEKIRPIDQKLKYQVDKMLKTASVGQLSSGPAVDPLHFRPNPAALLARTNQPDEDGADYDEDQDDDEGGDAGHSGSKKPDVYRPPMMEAVYYHEDERADKKQNARREKELAKVSNSSMMQQLREEFSDRPTEKRGLHSNLYFCALSRFLNCCHS